MIYLWLLLVIPVLIVLHFFTLKLTRRKALVFSNFDAIEKFMGKKLLSKNLILLTLRLIAILFFILSVAGMTLNYVGQATESNFVLAIDASGSMLANDYNPNRLEVAKESAIEFVDTLPINTKVGLVSFSGASFIKSQLTDNFLELKRDIKSVGIELVGGTAIGDAIITSTNLLLTEKNSRVIVLITDGQNNIGATMDEAIIYANDKNILINAIGIGTGEGGEFIGVEGVISQVDEEGLKKIATETNGKYFLAKNKEELKNAYSQITDIKERRIALDLSIYLLLAGLVLLIMEWILMNTRYRTIP